MGRQTNNQRVGGVSAFERPAPHMTDKGQVHMIIAACDYKNTDQPLTSIVDAKHIEELAQVCGVSELVCLYDNNCTRIAVLEALAEVGSNCLEEDFFVFYYSGHGVRLEVEECLLSDHADGTDEAFVCVGPDGKWSYETLLLDDDFAIQMRVCFPKLTRKLILTDCCHSATICNMAKYIWRGQEAAHLAGCLSAETAGDTGRSGIFSHSMMLALQKLVEHEQDSPSVAAVYNAILLEDQQNFVNAQDISLSVPEQFSAQRIPWPLIPPRLYKAPLCRAVNASINSSQMVQRGAQSGKQLLDSPLRIHGVKPTVAEYAEVAREYRDSTKEPLFGSRYVNHVVAADVEDWSPGQNGMLRSCNTNVACSIQ